MCEYFNWIEMAQDRVKIGSTGLNKPTHLLINDERKIKMSRKVFEFIF
jgi:hypothetical protein